MSEHDEDFGIAEEIAHSVTHGVGFFLGVAALVLLIVFAVRSSTPIAVVSASIYGSTLVLLYAVSTLYHALRPGRAKRVFQVLDHSAIFLLIAGTYTPYTLVSMPTAWGWSIFGVIWGLAALGVTLEAVFRRRQRRVQLILYLIMGWLIVIAARPLVSVLPMGGLVLLISGGVFYSLGVIFYRWYSLPFHHAVWHLFVLAGSACHVFSVLFYVVGPNSRP